MESPAVVHALLAATCVLLAACGAKTALEQATNHGDANGDDAASGNGNASGNVPPQATCASPPVPCNEQFPGQPTEETSQQAASALLGRWLFCGSPPSYYDYGANQIGEEYAQDGTYYELIMSPNGVVERNPDPSTRGTWAAKIRSTGALEIDLDTGILGYGGVSACPPSLIVNGMLEKRAP